MLHYLYSILFSRNPNIILKRILLILAIALAIVLVYKQANRHAENEGFDQDSKFVLKRNENVYDDFYGQIMDTLNKPEITTPQIMSTIIEMTQPSREYSVFLDVGSGTGYLVNQLKSDGFRAFGIDKSAAMKEQSESKYPEIEIKCGDVQEPMSYERNTFTHIICNGFTIYQFQDKLTFFRNCYYWLSSNSYLILHLVEPLKYNPIVPVKKSKLFNSVKKDSDNRITDTFIDFIDFNYKTSYDFTQYRNEDTVSTTHSLAPSDRRKKDGVVTFTETFTDAATANIRQNEQTLYMKSPDAILKIATYCGFLVKGVVTMGKSLKDEHQFIYILEKPM